ncbi:Fc.00g023860.m01.CDS01 [Cosmosporella sp. VM-42]
MVSLRNIMALGLMGGALALPRRTREPDAFPTNVGCGEVNVFYTGFTAYHPYVIDQGLDPIMVDHDLRNDTAALVRAGYNVRVLFQGPEQPMSNLADRMAGTEWDIDAMGFGIRGYRNGTATRRFEDNLYQFHKSAPGVPSVFNWGGTTLAESVIRRAPLNEDCTDKPGTLIAYEEICDPSVCEKTTVILDGDLSKLTEGI